MTLNPQAQDLDLAYFARVLRRALLPVLALSLALATLAYFYSRTQPEVFKATASLAALPTTSGNSLISNTLVTAPAVPANVVARALHSAAVTNRAVARIKKQFPSSAVATQTVQAIQEELQSGHYNTVSLGAEIDQNLVGSYEISVLAGSPEVAKGAADAFALALLDWDRERALNGINRARTNLLTQRDMLNQGMLAGGEVVTGPTLDQLRKEVVQSLQQIEVLRQTVSGTLSPLSTAILPTRAVAPKPVRNALLVFGASLFLGLLGALARDSVSRRVQNEDSLRPFGLPILGMLPPLSRSLRQNIRRMLMDPVYREQMEFVRVAVEAAFETRLKQETSEDQLFTPPVLAVSSANAHEGKSTITSGLAFVCAERGMKVLIVDADVFRRQQHALLVSGRERHFESREILDSTVWNGVLHNVDLMTLKSNRLDPEKLRQTINYIKIQYDIVLIDTPPALKIADTIAVARLIDGLLLVVDVQTPLAHVERLMDDIQRSNVNLLGYVLNRYKQSGSHYTYAYDARTPGREWKMGLKWPTA